MIKEVDNLITKDIYINFISSLKNINIPILVEEELSQYYPNFNQWFFTKVFDKHLYATRLVYTAVSDGKFLGLGIAHHDPPQHNKINTIYVMPEYRRQGIGKKLMELAINYFDDKKLPIMITISEFKRNELEPFFNKFGFEFSHVIEDTKKYIGKEIVLIRK